MLRKHVFEFSVIGFDEFDRLFCSKSFADDSVRTIIVTEPKYFSTAAAARR
ncbi:MAG: hypothetical protein ACREML_10820 [Vulcanimicrobiaceae bacterium]